MKLNLLVIKTANPAKLKAQYEVLGLDFAYHKHGNGPMHYACESENLTFEIYPLPKSKPKADNTTRLGFIVDRLDSLVPQLKADGWIVQSPPSHNEWGYSAIIVDLDGRKVELTQTSK